MTYDDSVVGASYVVSVGFDLTGDLVRGKKLTFGHLKTALESGNAGQLRKLKSSFSFVDPLGNPVAIGLRDFLPNWVPAFGNIEDRIQEWYLDKTVSKEGFDEFLCRLLTRKNFLLTKGAREGLAHIKLLNAPTLELYQIDGGNEHVDPADIDRIPAGALGSSIRNDRSILKYKAAPFNQPDFSIRVKSKPSAIRRSSAQLQLYLQVKLEPVGRGQSENSEFAREISRVAAVSAVVNPFNLENGSEGWLPQMDTAYVDLRCCATEFSLQEQSLLEAILQPSSISCNGGQNLVPFYQFLVALIWVLCVGPTRRMIGSPKWPKAHEVEDYQRSYLQPEVFMEELVNMQAYVSYRSKTLIMRWLPSNLSPGGLEEIYRINPTWVKFVSKSFIPESANEAESDSFLSHLIQHGVLATDDGYATLVGNGAVAFESKEVFPMPKLAAGFLDFEEFGSGWSTSWFILLGGMLCSLAETFLIYDAKIEHHVQAGESVYDLKQMTRQALEDFLPYYEVGVVAGEVYDRLFEEAKRAFGIERYHRVLAEKLNLFSNNEIAQANLDSSYLILVLTTFIIAFGVLGVLAGRIPSWNLALVGIGIAFASALGASWALRKTYRFLLSHL